MVELEYIEVGGLLYPNIDTGSEELSQLEKYGKMRLKYIHAQRPALYRELLFTGKLAEHCQRIEAEAFDCRSVCACSILQNIQIHQARMQEILDWVIIQYPSLEPKIAWKQPMFQIHGTFIIGFSVAKNHISVSPEGEGIDHFLDAIKESGYSHGKKLFQIPWNSPIDYDLLNQMIEYNLIEKQDLTTFWRK